ncbi:protein rep, partial [Sphingomonas glacialis]|uniref:protein rep n=1 Tax=Sphingomonas glacialis TaxID=658225 RepID=UPI001E3A6AA3
FQKFIKRHVKEGQMDLIRECNTFLSFVAQQEESKSFIFLTLTTPNVTAEHLEGEIQKYNKSFKKMIERKKIKSIAKGYVRKLEVTYNAERDDYHSEKEIKEW